MIKIKIKVRMSRNRLKNHRTQSILIKKLAIEQHIPIKRITYLLRKCDCEANGMPTVNKIEAEQRFIEIRNKNIKRCKNKNKFRIRNLVRAIRFNFHE
jgi:hypothetical protein